MNRKMWVLNGLLALLAIWAGVQWRSQYVAEKSKERRMLNATVPPKPATPLPAIPPEQPVQPAGYNLVAQKLLLHPERNPNIEIPPPPPPPPPEPMPPLPKFHGSMNLDGEAVAIMSAGTDRYKEIKPGQTIGQFKLIDVNTRDITLQWKDQQVRKRLTELLDQSQTENAPQAAVNPAANAPAAPAAPAIKTQIGPKGETSVFGRRACDPNDSYPEGAVVDGWKKTSSTSPFGKACFWEPAK